MNEWQKIETAPKDGTKAILAKIAPTGSVPELDIPAKPAHVWWATSGYWDSVYKHWTNGLEKLVPPSHWMHLPEPPEQS